MTFLLFQFHLNVISLCFAMITLEEQPVLLLVNVTEQEFVIQGERGHVFLFQTVNICWFGRLSGLHLCSLNTAWDKLPALIILLFIWRPCKQVKAATEHTRATLLTRILQTTGIYKLLSLFWLNLNISLG